MSFLNLYFTKFVDTSKNVPSFNINEYPTVKHLKEVVISKHIKKDDNPKGVIIVKGLEVLKDDYEFQKWETN